MPPLCQETQSLGQQMLELCIEKVARKSFVYKAELNSIFLRKISYSRKYYLFLENFLISENNIYLEIIHVLNNSIYLEIDFFS